MAAWRNERRQAILVLPQPSSKLAVSVFLSTIVVFIGDIITPLGFAEAILYLLPLLLSSFLYDPRLPIRLAGVSTGLVVAGFVLSPPGAPVAYAVLNRTLAVIVLWTAAFGLRRLIQDRITHLQAEYRWQLLAHQTHDILWDWNMLTSDHWWSENAIEIFGYDPIRETSIDAWQSRLHPQDRSRILTGIHAAIEQGQSGWTDEYQFRMRDGSYHTFLDRGRIIREASGTAVRMIGAMIDVTARKQSEAALQLSNQQFADLVDNLHGVVWEAEAGSMAFRLVSPHAEQLLGYPVRQWLDEPDFWPDHIHPADRDATVARCLAATAQGLAHSAEYRMIAADGRVVWVHDVITVACEAGLPKTVRGVLVDITKRKQAEQALQTLALATASVTGSEFFPQLVRHMAQALNVSHALVAEVPAGNRLRARTLAVWMRDRQGENFEYDLAGTPCAGVVGKTLCLYPEGVRTLFPHDRILQTMEAESYMGIPLWSSSGQPLGVLAVLDDKPFHAQQDMEPLLAIFAARASAELERIWVDRSMREHELAVRELYDITTSSTRSFEAQVEAILDLGRRHFNYPIGILTHAAGDQTELQIVRASGLDIPVGARVPFHGSPCERAIVQQASLDIPDLPRSPFAEHVISAGLGLRSYFGTGVCVQDRTYGTVCFLSPEAAAPRAETDNIFLQLMARWIGTALEREETLAALRNSEERKSAILNAALDGIVTIDAEERIIEFNPAAEVIFGYARQAVLGHRVDDLIIPPALRERHRLGMAHCLQTGSGPFFDRRVEITAMRADGSEFPVELSLTRIEGQHPPLFTAFIRDLTERKKSETALLESEARFRQLAESITEVFWLTTPEKETMLYVSPAYETVWGKSCQSLYRDPASWLEAIHPDDRPRVATAMQQTQAEGRYCEQYRIIRPDGTIRWIEDRAFPVKDHAGRIARIAGVAQDITDRIEAETSLRASEARLMEAQRIAGIGSWQWDARSDVTWSDETYRIFGYVPQSIIPSYELFLRTLHADDRAGMSTALRATLSENAPFDIVCRILRPSGEQRHIRCRGAVNRDSAGAPVRVVGTVEDVTDRKRADDQLRQAYAQLQDVTRHAAAAEENERRRIAREIHDELGQLLTAMRFQLTSLKKQRGANAARDQTRDRDSRLNDLLDLSDSMLSQVRQLSTSLRPAILDELGLIPAVQAHARQFEIRTGIACDVVVDPSLTDCPFDDATSSSVFRIIQELLTNVLRHAQAMAVTVSFAVEGPTLTVTVHDNGSGIAPEQERHQTSFGLKGISERAALLGGTFAIGPSPAEGTVATLRIPMSVLSPAPLPPTPHQEDHENPVGRRPRTRTPRGVSRAQRGSPRSHDRGERHRARRDRRRTIGPLGPDHSGRQSAGQERARCAQRHQADLPEPAGPDSQPVSGSSLRQAGTQSRGIRLSHQRHGAGGGDERCEAYPAGRPLRERRISGTVGGRSRHGGNRLTRAARGPIRPGT